MSTLKKPLFINGMYNREGKNCRADFVRYYKRNSGTGSAKIYEIIEQIRAAIIAD